VMKQPGNVLLMSLIVMIAVYVRPITAKMVNAIMTMLTVMTIAIVQLIIVQVNQAVFTLMLTVMIPMSARRIPVGLL